MAVINKLTWAEAKQYLWDFNTDHNITCKGIGKARCEMVAVITADSFDKPYTEFQRSYMFTNHNKAFIANQLSNSIFADCLDGTDNGVRLDYYVHDAWKVDYCYIDFETDGEEK